MVREVECRIWNGPPLLRKDYGANDTQKGDLAAIDQGRLAAFARQTKHNPTLDPNVIAPGTTGQSFRPRTRRKSSAPITFPLRSISVY